MPSKFVEFYQDLEMTEPDKRLKKIDNQISKYPNEPWYYWMKASFYVYSQEDDKVIENYKLSIKVDSSFAAGYGSYARHLIGMANADLNYALTLINKAIQLDPNELFYFLDRAEIYLQLKKFDLAHKDVDYVMYNPDMDMSMAKQIKVKILLKENRKEELKSFLMINDMTEGAEFTGTDFCMSLGAFYEEIGQRENACKMYRAAADPYLMMEESVPTNIQEKLKSCK